MREPRYQVRGRRDGAECGALNDLVNTTNNDALLVAHLGAKNGTWCGVVLSLQGVPRTRPPSTRWKTTALDRSCDRSGYPR